MFWNICWNQTVHKIKNRAPILQLLKTKVSKPHTCAKVIKYICDSFIVYIPGLNFQIWKYQELFHKGGGDMRESRNDLRLGYSCHAHECAVARNTVHIVCSRGSSHCLTFVGIYWYCKQVWPYCTSLCKLSTLSLINRR